MGEKTTPIFKGQVESSQTAFVFQTKPKRSHLTNLFLLILDCNGHEIALCVHWSSKTSFVHFPLFVCNASFSCLAGPQCSSVMSIPLDTPKPLMDQSSQNNLNPNYQSAQPILDYNTPFRPNLPQSESNLPININPLTLQAQPQGRS